MENFKKFTKIPRLGSKKDNMIITEKIDGTNSQITIEDGCIISVGSRNRFITPGEATDNYGFAQWVQDNTKELLKLGDGTHYGEWWGVDIQRRYEADKKYFSLFNTYRPVESLPECVQQVPVLYRGTFGTDIYNTIFNNLWESGSYLVDWKWFKPEGIVLYHATSRQLFKMTYDYMDGKWTHK